MRVRGRDQAWRGISIVLLAMVAGSGLGCTALAERVANHLVEKQAQAAQDLLVFEGDVAAFHQCLKVRGASCSGSATTPLPGSRNERNGALVGPVTAGTSTTLTQSVATLPDGHAAQQAFATLRHPVAQQAYALHDHLRGHPASSTAVDGIQVEDKGDAGSQVGVHLRVAHAAAFADQVHATNAANGWQALEKHCGTHTVAPSHPDAPAFGRDCRTATFLRGYFAAYFRQAEFVEVTLDTSALQANIATDASKLEQRVPTVARDGVESAANAIEGAVDSATRSANTQLSNVLRISSQGFVSRDTSFQAKVPGFEVSATVGNGRGVGISVRDGDTGAIVDRKTDLANLGVATDHSGVGTGSAIGAEVVRVFLEAVFDAHEGLPGLAPANVPAATGLSVGVDGLPLFRAPMGHVDAGDLGAMSEFNTRVATRVRAILGRVVAGIGPLSLNNQALEDLIVELVTTSVRKAVEKGSWCWFACNLDQDLDAVREDANAVAKDAASALRGAAQRVGLHLRVDG